MNLHSTRSSRISSHISALSKAGLDVALEFSRNGLPSLALAQPDVRLFSPHMYSVLHKLGRREGFSNLGLFASMQQQFGTFEEPFKSHIASSFSVYQALSRFFIALNIVNPTRCGSIEIRGETAFVVISVSDPEPTATWLNYSDWNIVWLITEIMRYALGRFFVPEAVSLVSTWAIPSEVNEVLPGTKISCGHPNLEVAFASALLSNPYKSERPTEPVGCKINEADPQADFPQIVAELLRPYLLDRDAGDLGRFSDILGTSPRTLQRRLRASGTSFSDLLAQERTRLAMKMMQQSELSLAEISTALGYAEQSSFTRAFGKIMGVSPGMWQRLQAG